MRDYCIGIDSGSTNCKAVLMKEHKIMDFFLIPTGWDPAQSAKVCLEEILRKNVLKRSQCKVFTTGYGRESIHFADDTFTEITCHAQGAVFLEPSCKGVLDIGGQDSKVIRLEDGRVSDFLMNDKCAAGTGRFLMMSSDKLEIDIQTIDHFLQTEETVAISSMCAVFAEAEIIGHLAKKTPRAHLLNGILDSIASRMQGMLVKMHFRPKDAILFTGGLAFCQKLAKKIEQASNFSILQNGHSIYAGAIGASVYGEKKNIG